VRISLERSILVAEQFLQELIKKYGKNPVSTDGGTWYPSQACRFLKLRHHIHSYYERSIIERTIQYIKKIEQNALMIIFHVKKITVH
jgi:putative transposase